MSKSNAARFLTDLAEPDDLSPGTRVVFVRAIPSTKALVSQCLEQLGACPGVPENHAEWDEAATALAQIAHHASEGGQKDLSSAAAAMSALCAVVAAEPMAVAAEVAPLFDELHTRLTELLIRVYIVGNDAGSSAPEIRRRVLARYPALYFQLTHSRNVVQA